MHFIAHCQRYPQFALNVHALRPFLDNRGLKMESTVIHFKDGLFDSREEGFSEEEAKVIHDGLRACSKFPPLYGQQITVKEYTAPEPKKGK